MSQGHAAASAPSMPSNGPRNGPRNGCRKRPQRGENTGLVCKTVLALGCGGSVDQCRGRFSGGSVGLCRGPPQRCAVLPCCRHHNACPNPTGCFLHCPCPCTARQRGRGGKAVNPLSDLAACKCRNRGSQTAPGQRPLRPPAVTASQRSADRAPGRPALQAG